MNNFCHLHRHSEWSLGDGTGTSEQYAEQAVVNGQSALAITDHGTLAGTLYHMQACERVGIKPIMGMEAYFRPSIQADRENKDQYGYYHLVLLAQNEKGWKNLMRISSESHDDVHFYQKPSVDWSLLRRNSEGIIATSSCLQGYIPQRILQGQEKAAENHLKEMLSVFGDRFYFEIQPHDIPEQKIINDMCVAMAKANGIPFIATSDVHYPYKEWRETQHIRTLIGFGKTVRDEEQSEDGKEYGGLATTFLATEDEVRAQFAQYHTVLRPDEIDEAIKTTQEVADRCDPFTIDRSPKVPKASKNIFDAERILREWCEEGLVRIGKENDEVYRDRMEEELAVMRKLKVLDYFIFVADMVRWAKSNNIRVGAGRGSAGGSLVCYLTRITALDPIGYDLLFERFLNEYRTEIPDIDVDFDPEGRPKIKAYLAEKWGADKVIDVAAFQSFGLKAAIKDVSRALHSNYTASTKAAEEIPKLAFGETLESLAEKLPKLKQYAENFPEVWTHACRLQGCIKGASKHAAAVIVTDRPAHELIPLMRAKDGSITTQWSERASTAFHPDAALLSPYGFLKVDMLVTKALAQQARAFELIKERHGIECDNVNDFFEDVERFPVNTSPMNSDRDVVEAFAYGRNLGIFQFASADAGRMLKAVQPEHLDHVIAINALNRPGASSMIGEYAARKNGKPWQLPHPAAAEFLSRTYGIILYQEQVMQMYRALGKDVQPSESALFIKVVAKGIARDLKGKEKLQAYYDKFAAGAKEKGLSKTGIDAIWSQILQMTTYSFNRSHSAGYGLQSYQDQWLKIRYPLEFYEPLLTYEEDKIPQIVRESRAFSLGILPPDINESNQTFTVSGNKIRFGLMAVKGVADAGYNEIKTHRPFSSLDDFEQRVAKRKVNSRARTALIESGAFDSLGERADWSTSDKSAAERQHIGIALSSGDDSQRFNSMLREFTDPFELLEDNQEENGSVSWGGEIVSISEHKTKKGSDYARVNIDLEGNTVQAIFWSEKYSKFRHILYDGAIILVAGNFDSEYGNISVEHACPAEQLYEELKKN